MISGRATRGSGSAFAGGGANVFITGVEPLVSGKIAQCEYLPGTVPASKVVTAVNLDHGYVRVSLEWDGGKDYSGSFTVNGSTVTGIAQLAGDRRYTGYCDINVSGSHEIVVKGNGGKAEASVSFMDAAPDIEDITFESLPQGQTELKTGDQISVLITLAQPADITDFVTEDFEAFAAQTAAATAVSETIYRIVLVVDHDHSGLNAAALRLRVRSKIATGGIGGAFDSVDTLPCNNLLPSVSFDSVAYPSGQQALKDSETAQISVSYSHCDEATFSGNGLSVAGATLIEPVKIVQRIAGAGAVSQQLAGENITVTVKRHANAASRSYSTLIKIANLAAALTASPARDIRETTALPLDFNQPLLSLSVDAVSAGAKGTLQGAGAAFSQQVIVSDNHARSAVSQSINLTAVNLAGRSSQLTKGYRLIGFTQRTLTLTHPALSVSLPVNVVNMSKISVEGRIDSAPPFILSDMQQQPSLTLANHYDITGGNVLKLSPATQDFGYHAGQSITIQIEEKL